MQKQLSVQAFATQRNGQVELLMDYILGLFLKELINKKIISSYSEPTLQKRFTSDDCSDVFDHYFELTPINEKGKIQFWLQTTCYKGNELGDPEPNKTYEIRETLIEALGLRSRLIDSKQKFRTIHFTVGSTEYTYPWFIDAKNNAFDLSIYTGGLCGEKDLFDVLEDLLKNTTAEFEVVAAFEKAVGDKELGLSTFVVSVVNKLLNWYLEGMPKSKMADEQANLLTEIREKEMIEVRQSIEWSKQGGENIKGRAIEMLQGSDIKDPLLVRTLQQLLDNKPFLKVGIDASSDWEHWQNKYIPKPSTSNLSQYLMSLWTVGTEAKLVIRRLLIRMHTGDGVRYPSDLYVRGISEHNLYGGNHTEAQVSEIIDRLITRYSELGINDANLLYQLISSGQGKLLLKDSIRLESYNGTSLKPSFTYVELALSPKYRLTSFIEAKLPQPTAYHSRFGNSRVDPYSNLKVVTLSTNSKPIALIKSKYFRKQEFPRRAKEEAYVGFTTKYDYINEKFIEKYPGLPMIMFVDMDKDLIPQEYAVTRLATSGWVVIFSIDHLLEYLAKYA